VILRDLVVGIIVATIYCLLGYSASKEKFNPKKFLGSWLIAFLVALGLHLTPEDLVKLSWYEAILSPTVIAIFVKKIIDVIVRKEEKT